MKTWSDITLIDFESARTLPQISVEMGYLTERMGFDFWCYAQVSYKHFSQPRRSVLSNLPRQWQTLYQERNFAATDPVIAHGLRSSKPVIWSPELFDKELGMWETAQIHGLCVGWSQSSRVQGSSSVGILSLVRSSGEITEAEVAEKQGMMHWITQVVHQKSVSLRKSSFELTEKEATIMRWTADGKTTSEIADILSIKERSVTFQITKVLVRLGVQNKTAAAVRLAMNGLLN